ncbi:HAD hydrolase-like protein, partial [Listeria monocytogenes]|uniref:HAD hydrolase-like protein n=1 Tax=Listeria monocytogenes TaxID=1639 RepID=UPI002AFDF6E7
MYFKIKAPTAQKSKKRKVRKKQDIQRTIITTSLNLEGGNYMYKAIIFDVDGTILDTERAVLHSLQAVLAEEGLSYELDELRFVLG